MTTGNAANPFEPWKEMFQKSTEAWAQAAGAPTANPFWPPTGGAMPGMFPGGQMPGFGGFAPPFAVNDLQAMWQRFFNSWAEQWSKT